MRVAVFDAWAGVAGDMWVGALLDAGVPLEPLARAVETLGLPGVEVAAEKVLRAGLAGTQFRVLENAAPADGGGVQFAPLPAAAPLHRTGRPGHVHRGLREIEALVRAADLPERVRERCLEVYRRIGEVEAAAHGTTIDRVHFHEVGAVDTVVDVVCACLGMHLADVQRVHAGVVELGSGTVRAAHGILPVPAPATAALLRGVPVRQGGLPGERTTPTGAALLRTFVDEFAVPVQFVPEAIGYGAGTRDDALAPNLLRVAIGRAAAASSPTGLVELQCQVDTATGEQIGWLLDELLRRGAVDAFATAIHMKKGRPGFLLTVLCPDAAAEALADLLLEESSSLGVRRQRVERTVVERWQESRPSPLGAVQWKVARLPSGHVVARPEDDEVRRLARELGIGRAEVLRRLLG